MTDKAFLRIVVSFLVLQLYSVQCTSSDCSFEHMVPHSLRLTTVDEVLFLNSENAHRACPTAVTLCIIICQLMLTPIVINVLIILCSTHLK